MLGRTSDAKAVSDAAAIATSSFLDSASVCAASAIPEDDNAPSDTEPPLITTVSVSDGAVIATSIASDAAIVGTYVGATFTTSIVESVSAPIAASVAAWDVLELCDFCFLASNSLLPLQFHTLRDSVPNAPLLDGGGHARVLHCGRC